MSHAKPLFEPSTDRDRTVWRQATVTTCSFGDLSSGARDCCPSHNLRQGNSRSRTRCNCRRFPMQHGRARDGTCIHKFSGPQCQDSNNRTNSLLSLMRATSRTSRSIKDCSTFVPTRHGLCCVAAVRGSSGIKFSRPVGAILPGGPIVASTGPSSHIRKNFPGFSLLGLGQRLQMMGFHAPSSAPQSAQEEQIGRYSQLVSTGTPVVIHSRLIQSEVRSALNIILRHLREPADESR
jgi:hypothetical protein